MAGNGSSGQVGNVNSVLNDVNGNLMYATNTSGLFVFNPFTGNNTANGSDITLIPNTVDSSSSGGLAGKILTGVQITYYSVKTIATVAALGATQTQPGVVEHPGLALGRTLGQESYRGQFLYTETQLHGMGLENGAIIRGVRFRSSQGITPDPETATLFKSFKVTLSQGKTLQGSDDLNLKFAKNIGKQRKVVTQGPLPIGAKSFPTNSVYPGSPIEGEFGKTIWFDRPYVYKGGNLLMDISHNGHRSTNPLLIDAFGTPRRQGIYKPLAKGGVALGIRAVPAVEFVY